MNFLNLINKCLLELNFRQISKFSELVKNDHKRIVSILNVINNEVCNSEKWNFLLRNTTLTLPEKTSEIKNTIPGRIWYLIIDGQKYKYTEDIEAFLTGGNPTGVFSICADKILLPQFPEKKEVKILYYSKYGIVDENGEEKENFENETDKSLIPMPFAEQILVYGTCLRVKANPQHIKFAYWMSMYKEAILNLKSKSSGYVLSSPSVILHRD